MLRLNCYFLVIDISLMIDIEDVHGYRLELMGQSPMVVVIDFLDNDFRLDSMMIQL